MRSKWTSILATGVLASGGVAEIGTSSASAQAVSGGLPTAGTTSPYGAGAASPYGRVVRRPMRRVLFRPTLQGAASPYGPGSTTPYGPGAVSPYGPGPATTYGPNLGTPPAGAGGTAAPTPVRAPAHRRNDALWCRDNRPDGDCRAWPRHPAGSGNAAGFGFNARATERGNSATRSQSLGLVACLGPRLGRQRSGGAGKEAIGPEKVLFLALAWRLEQRG